MFGDAGAAPDRLRRARLDQGALDRRRPDRRSTRPGTLVAVRPGDPAAARPRALGRHRDLDVLDRLHGRRRPLRRARRHRGPGPAVRRLAPPLAAVAASLAGLAGRRPAGPATRRARGRRHRRSSRWCPRPASRRTSTRTRNGRVYAGTLRRLRQRRRAVAGLRVDRASGTLLRSWTVPGQDLGRRARRPGRQPDPRRPAGRARDVDLDGAHPQPAHRPLAHRSRTLPAAPSPTTRPGDRGGALYVTDYAARRDLEGAARQRRSRGAGSARRRSTARSASAPPGIVFRTQPPRPADHPADRRRGATLPTQGHLYRLPIKRRRPPRRRSRRCGPRSPATCPTASASAASGHVYVALAGLDQPARRARPRPAPELRRFPDAPLTGDNGSPIPFDTPVQRDLPRHPGAGRQPVRDRRATPPTRRSSPSTSASAGGRRTCRRRRLTL